MWLRNRLSTILVSNRNLNFVLKQEIHPCINISMYHVLGSFSSTSATLNGNISDVHWKNGITYKSVKFRSIRHAATSCTLSFHKISEY